MSDRIRTNKPLVEPVYTQADVGETIDFGEEKICFNFAGKTHHTLAKVAMSFAPHDGLKFLCPLERDVAMLLHFGDNDVLELTLENRMITFDAFAAGGAENSVAFWPTNSGFTVTAPSTGISKAIFHLFNFPDFHGPDNYVFLTGEPPLQGATSCGLVVLKAEGWCIRIVGNERTRDLLKALNARGGYVLTHVGEITREDGQEFCSAQLEDLLDCLHSFLSFALGRWSGVSLPIGFDANGNRVFEQWGMKMTADGVWNSSTSWFDDRHSELLPEVFAGFMALWANPVWRTPLSHTLY